MKSAYLAAAKANDSSTSDVDDADAFLGAEIAYLTGDLASYAKLVTRFEAPFFRFRAAFCRGQLEEAEKSLSDARPQDADAALLLYLLAVQQNNANAAEGHFQAALAALKTDGNTSRRVAELASAARPDAQAICRAHLAPDTKRILLTALGVRVPADRATYFEWARKLNFLPEFPQQFLAATLKL